MPRLSILILMYVVFLRGEAQQRPIELQIIQPIDELNPDLTQERSMVLISTKTKGDEWKEYASYLHKSFRLMGIDAVTYTHYIDYTSSPSIQRSYRQYANGRKIAFIILLHQDSNGFELAVLDRRTKPIGQKCWYAKGSQLSEVVVALAIALKRTDHVNQNFLISQEPEYSSILPVFTGNQLLNYPDRIKRLRLAYMEIPEITVQDTISDQQIIRNIEMYNQQVRETNEKVRNEFANYPYKIEFFPLQDESELYRQGFQYVLYFARSSSASLRETLGFREEEKLEYVSQVFTGDQRAIKSFEADMPVYKWYIKQIVVSDIHVGRYWDADLDLIASLQTFQKNLLQALEK